MFFSNSNIDEIHAFKESDMYFYDGCNIGSIDICHKIDVQKSNIDDLKKAHYVEIDSGLNAPTQIGNINADFVSLINYNIEAGNITSNSVMIEGNDLTDKPIKVKKIKSNKLLINANPDFKENPNYGKPVEVDSANITSDKIMILKEKLDVCTSCSLKHGLHSNSSFHNISYPKGTEAGYANITNFKINSLKCDTLDANKGKIKKADVKSVRSLNDVNIEELRAEKIENMNNVHIKKLIVPSDSIVIPKGNNIKIDMVEFENESGIIVLQNKNNEL